MKNKIEIESVRRVGGVQSKRLLQFDPEPIDNQWTLILDFETPRACHFRAARRAAAPFTRTCMDIAQDIASNAFRRNSPHSFMQRQGLIYHVVYVVMFGIIRSLSSIVLSVGTQSLLTSVLENKETMSWIHENWTNQSTLKV